MLDLDPLFESYNHHFEVLDANSPALLDQAYRLRYQVYCIENAFEQTSEHPFGREQDEHDAISAHILLRHRASGAAVGTARLIMPHLADGWHALPIAGVLAPTDRMKFERLPSHRTAEISRFAISKQFRAWWRDHRQRALVSNFNQSKREDELLLRYITFGLFDGILRISNEHKIDYVAAVMKTGLISILEKFGIDFEPLGGLVDYHGVRQPCVVVLADLIERSRMHCTPLWQFVRCHEVAESARGSQFS
jgi:N-acyl amino acid synthase of PEP-CTERM/exosortase system